LSRLEVNDEHRVEYNPLNKNSYQWNDDDMSNHEDMSQGPDIMASNEDLATSKFLSQDKKGHEASQIEQAKSQENSAENSHDHGSHEEAGGALEADIPEDLLHFEDHKDPQNRRKSIQQVAKQINKVGEFSSLFEILQQENLSWMDLFDRIDSDHSNRVTSYDIYNYLNRSLKIKKAISAHIIKAIDFNLDGYTSREEWMKIESELPAEMTVNVTYANKKDFYHRLFSNIRDHGLTWMSIYQNAKMKEINSVPTRSIMRYMVSELKLPKHNTRKMLQEIDFDNNGVITEAEWRGHFKDDDIQDEEDRKVVFDEKYMQAVKAANGDKGVDPSDSDLKTYIRISNLGLLAGDVLNNKETVEEEKREPGLDIPLAEFEINVENVCRFLEINLEVIGNAGFQKGLTNMVSEHSPTSKMAGRSSFDRSPTDKNGPVAREYTIQGDTFGGSRALESMQAVKTESQPIGQPRFANSNLFASMDDPAVKIAYGSNSNNGRSRGLDDFSQDGGFDDMHANGEAFQDNFDENSVGCERSFTDQSSLLDDDDVGKTRFSCTTPDLVYEKFTAGHLASPDVMLEAAFSVMPGREGIALMSLVANLHRCLPDADRSLIFTLVKGLDDHGLGFVSPDRWNEFINNLKAQQFEDLGKTEQEFHVDYHVNGKAVSQTLHTSCLEIPKKATEQEMATTCERDMQRREQNIDQVSVKSEAMRDQGGVNDALDDYYY
jgi:hypothetical protein